MDMFPRIKVLLGTRVMTLVHAQGTGPGRSLSLKHVPAPEDRLAFHFGVTIPKRVRSTCGWRAAVLGQIDPRLCCREPVSRRLIFIT